MKFTEQAEKVAGATAKKLGYTLGNVYGKIEPIMGSFMTRKNLKGVVDEAEILGRFIDETLQPLLNGRRISKRTKYYEIMSILQGKTVTLNILGSIWEIPIEARVFRNKNVAGWTSFSDEEEPIRLIMRSGATMSPTRTYVYRHFECDRWYYRTLDSWVEHGHHYIYVDGQTWSFPSVSQDDISDYLTDHCSCGWDNFVATVFPKSRLVVDIQENGEVVASGSLFSDDSFSYRGNPIVEDSVRYAHTSEKDATTAVVDSKSGELRLFKNGTLERAFRFKEVCDMVAKGKNGGKVLAITRDTVYEIDTRYYTSKKVYDVKAITPALKVYSIKGEHKQLTLVVENDGNGSLVERDNSALLPNHVESIAPVDSGVFVMLDDNTFLTVAD